MSDARTVIASAIAPINKSHWTDAAYADAILAALAEAGLVIVSEKQLSALQMLTVKLSEGSE
jgi:hypothetical protein